VKLYILLLIGSLVIVSCGVMKYSVNGTLPPYFILSDTGNNRVLIWFHYPLSSYEAADIVLGQPDMNSGGSGTSSQSFNGPVLAYIDSALHLYIWDLTNNRILLWNSLPTQTRQAADVVIGQVDMNSFGTALAANRFNGAGQMAVVNGRLFIVDQNNHRVLIWNSIPTANGQNADIVLGQPDMNTANSSTSQSTFPTPWGLATDGQRLVISEFSEHRLLIWNTLPTTNQQPADLVLGQPSFSATAINNTPGAPLTVSAYGLKNPLGICIDGGKLFAADQGNNRVLIWNTFPTTMQQPADVVVGQLDMASSNNQTVNGRSANSLKGPLSVQCNGNQLLVADQQNHRVLIWNSIPTANGQNADIVLGQPDMASGTSATTSQGSKSPDGAISNAGFFGVRRASGY
jgi:hypothetical protein